MTERCTIILLALATSAFADSQWTRDEVAGLRMDLVDSKRIETYSCDKGGTVAVRIGIKRKITSELTQETISTPEWFWKIHDGRLQFSDGSSIREEFTLVEMGRGLVRARRRSGEIVRFRCQFERPKSRRWLFRPTTIGRAEGRVTFGYGWKSP